MYQPLIKGLKKYSQAKDHTLLEEWVPAGTLSDETTTVCICGKTHIVENYVIMNKITKHRVIVGSKCIQRFQGRAFEVAYDSGRYLSGKIKSIPFNVIERAYSHWKVISKWDRDFMISINMKRRLKIKQRKQRDRIEAQIKNKLKKLGFKN